MAKIKKSGLIKLIGPSIKEVGSWQYVQNGILEKIEGECVVETIDQQASHQQMILLITTVFPPDKLPMRFVKSDGQKDFNIMIPQERLAEMNALTDGLTAIFNSILQSAWLLIGTLGEDKREIAIIAIPEFKMYMYCLITKELKKVIGDNKYLLN